APDVALAERHRVVASHHTLPITAVQRVILLVHQKGERHLKGIVDFGTIERGGERRIDARQRRQNPKSREGEIEVEIADRLDQVAVETDLLMRLAQRSRDWRSII